MFSPPRKVIAGQSIKTRKTSLKDLLYKDSIPVLPPAGLLLHNLRRSRRIIKDRSRRAGKYAPKITVNPGMHKGKSVVSYHR